MVIVNGTLQGGSSGRIAGLDVDFDLCRSNFCLFCSGCQETGRTGLGIGETSWIRVNPEQVSELMDQPVLYNPFSNTPEYESSKLIACVKWQVKPMR